MDGRVRGMVRAAAEDYESGNPSAAQLRLQLAARTCGPSACSAATSARVHLLMGVVAVAQGDTARGETEFREALRVLPGATLDAGWHSADIDAAFQRASSGASGGSNSGGAGSTGGGANSSPARSAQLGDVCSSDAQCGADMHCDGGSCASGAGNGGGASAGPSSASGGASESASGSSSSSSSSSSSGASSSAEEDYWRFGVDLGVGLGMAPLSGRVQYDEYREWDGMGSGNFTCGQPTEDGSPSLVCPVLHGTQFGLAGFGALGLRWNFMRRVGLGLSVRFQPNASSVGILPSLFFGLRMYFALTDNGFARRGLVASLFVGTGVGQMQFRPDVLADLPAAHIISGLNNAHAGVRGEYGFGVVSLGAEVALNVQMPNMLFVTDVQAIGSAHF